MNRNSISGVSRALIAAVVLATAALSGCATVGDESFLVRWQRHSRTRSHDRCVVHSFAIQAGRNCGPLRLPTKADSPAASGFESTPAQTAAFAIDRA